MLLNSQTSLRLKDSRIYELHKAMDGTQIGLDSHSDGEGVVTILIRVILFSSTTLNYENFTIANIKKKVCEQLKGYDFGKSDILKVVLPSVIFKEFCV